MCAANLSERSWLLMPWMILGGWNTWRAKMLVVVSGVSGVFALASGGVDDLVRIDFPAGGGPSGIAVGDFDSDGFTDLVVVDSASGSVSVLFNDLYGIFIRRDVYWLPDGMSEPTAVVAGDLNGDGICDLAVTIRDAGFHESRLMILINDGDGLFQTTTFPVGWGASSIAIGDLDGDGDADLVTTSLTSRTMSRLFNDGAGGFDLVYNSITTQFPRQVVLEDVDGDGDLDFAMSWLHGVMIRMNDGSGGFSASFGYAAGSQPWGIAFGDADGDGDVDMAVTDSKNDTVRVFMNDGTGLFGEPAVYPTSAGPRAVLWRDLDGDGFADLLIASHFANEIEIRSNDGLSAFWQRTSRPNGLAPSGLVVADFDLDDVMDIAVSNLNGQSISVYAKYLCEGDLHPDGVVDFFDLTAFLIAFADGDPRSDLSGDGILDFYDLSIFITMYQFGCV